jgi:hypothetical protein
MDTRTPAGADISRDATNTESKGTREQSSADRGREDRRFDNDGKIQYATDTLSIGGGQDERIRNRESDVNDKISTPGTWQNFPTVSPLRLRDDGVSSKLLRFVVKELQDEISKTSQENRIQDLPKMWEQVQQEEIWEQIRGLYSLESKEVLYQTMQLYSTGWTKQRELSPFGENLSKPVLQHLREYKEFRYSPQGQELQKQRSKEFGDSLSFLPHEVALAARRFETSISKFEAWHRNESIKAGGNAIVPQVAFEIFKAIKNFTLTNDESF